MSRRRHFLQLLLAATLLLVCSPSHPRRTRTVHTSGTALRVLQIRTEKRGEREYDKKIPKSVLHVLRNRYKTLYKKYTLVKRDTRNAAMGAWEEFELDNKKVAAVKVHGYKPGPRLINLRIRFWGVEQKADVYHGKHWFALVEKGDTPLILVITPKLIQTVTED